MPGSGAVSRWMSRGLEPVDAAWLAAFRVLFGSVLAVSLVRFVAYGWVQTLFVEPRFHFKYWGFGWVPALPAAYAETIFLALAAVALAVAVGFLHRVTTPLLFLGFGWLQLVDVANYLNHYYLATLMVGLLALAPAGRVASVDAWWARRRSLRAGLPPPPTEIPRAWLWLFRFQVATVYTFAGIAKLHGDWLLHAQPLGIWLAARDDLPWIGALVRLPFAPLAMSWAGFLFDVSIAWILWFGGRRVRPFAYLVVIAFHVATRALFPIGMFPFIMVVSALAFFEPDWPRRLARAGSRLLGGRRGSDARGAADDDGTPAEPDLRSAPAPAERPRRLSRPLRVAFLLGALYAALQVAVPLRFLLYGGNVRWHEQGMRFSWRVMVREKNGSVTFAVRQVESGKVQLVSPRRYLTPLQERELGTQPDLVLQLAHHVKEDFERRGLGPVEVRAEVLVSMNGRRARLLLDPQVDLGRVSDGLSHAAWVLPAPTEPPPRIRPL